MYIIQVSIRTCVCICVYINIHVYTYLKGVGVTQGRFRVVDVITLEPRDFKGSLKGDIKSYTAYIGPYWPVEPREREQGNPIRPIRDHYGLLGAIGL